MRPRWLNCWRTGVQFVSDHGVAQRQALVRALPASSPLLMDCADGAHSAAEKEAFAAELRKLLSSDDNKEVDASIAISRLTRTPSDGRHPGVDNGVKKLAMASCPGCRMDDRQSAHGGRGSEQP